MTSESIFKTAFRLILQISLAEDRAAFHSLSTWADLRQTMPKPEGQQCFPIVGYIQACSFLLPSSVFRAPWKGKAGKYSPCRFPAEEDPTRNLWRLFHTQSAHYQNQHQPIPLVKTDVIISLSLPAGPNHCLLPLDLSTAFLLHCYLCFFLSPISFHLLLHPAPSLASLTPLSLYSAPHMGEKS